MLALKGYFENFLYFLIALLINLIFFNILYFFIFNIHIQEVEELPTLKVEIKEIPSPAVVRKSKGKVETQAVKKEKKVKKTSGVTANIPVAQKGDIPVKVEKKQEPKNVEILKEIKGKVLKKLEERERLAKEVGEISAIVSQRKVTIKVGTRKLTYIPPPPTFKVKEFPSSVKIKIWVGPSGNVIKALILQRSGIAEIDNGLLKFVKKLRFEPVETGEIQEGIITFTFTAG